MSRCHASVVLAMVLCACGGTSPRSVSTSRPRVESAPDLTVGEDLTERVRALHMPSHPGPLATFRAGSAAPAPLPPSAFTRDELGFRVRFPSGAPVATPAVHGDVVVVSGGFRSHEVFAIHAGRPELAWGLHVDDDGPSSPVCKDRVCVFNTESCTIYGVDSATGRLLWSWYLGDPLMSAPTIDGDLVFTAYPSPGGPEGATHAFAAFDLHTGELRWTRWIDADIISAPVAIAGAVYAASFGGVLYHFDQRSGELVSARRALATSAPSVIDGALYFARRSEAPGERARESIMRSSRKQAAPAQEMGAQPAPYVEYEVQSRSAHGQSAEMLDLGNGFSEAPAAANLSVARALIGRGTVSGAQAFQGSWVLGLGPSNYTVMGDVLLSHDRQSGRERWRHQLRGDLSAVGGALAAPPAAAGDRIVVATLDGEVLLVREDGTITQRYRAAAPLRTQPVVHEGWIYAGTDDGQLIAIDTGDRTLTGWTAWAGNAARTGHPM